jgi:hypothetical protein
VGFPSGQRDQTVNLTAKPSKVRILLPPPLAACAMALEPLLFFVSKSDAVVGFAVLRTVRGYGSMVEPQPSKLKMRVRFPLPAPHRFGGVGQLLARG